MSIELEKYKGQSTRHTCPKCGRKHSFTRYIDKETNAYVNEKVGICNRKIKCGYHLSPKQFFENNLSVHRFSHPKNEVREPQSEINTNELEEKEIRENSCKSVDKKKEIIPIKQIDKEYLKQTFSKPSNFLTFLKNTFPNDVVEQIILDYFLSATKDKSVIFWQIDKQFRIRTGKIMQYDSQTGKRVKNSSVHRFSQINMNELEAKEIRKSLCKSVDKEKVKQFVKPISWVHSELKRKGILSTDWQLRQCLFGEHLVAKYPQKPICLVESEKTAIVMACFHPCFNWLATGGLQNFSKEKLYAIRKEKIMAFPDLKCFELWKSKAEKINHEIGSKIEVSSFLEENSTPEKKEKGLDIADFYLSEKLKTKR